MKKTEFKIVSVMVIIMYMDMDRKGTQKLDVTWSAGFMSILKFKVYFHPFLPYPILCFGMLTFEVNPHLASFGFIVVAVLN